MSRGLNEHQVRRILATFGHVDDLLKSVEALAHPDTSPFSRERPNLSPDEARLLLSFVSGARSRMLAALDRLGIPRPEQNLSARRSASTALLFAQVSLSELNTRSLRGYGALDQGAGAEVTAVAADLETLMRRGMDLLEEQEAGGLAEQVATLRGPAGDVLRALLKISTERGLAKMRPLIAAAAERAAATTFDVGVFGRVSSGKSSLINALVGGEALPVGATPVTAVPVRVHRGMPAVEVRFRDGRAEKVTLAELSFYATEEHNAQNKKSVLSIEATLPTAPEGLRFVDTPGVGSLAASGPAQAYAWLPRCDLGVVLVAAGTPLGRDENALVAGLRHAGIECRVMLSKADLFDPAEADRARAYVARELAPMLGGDDSIDVLPVSTRPGHSEGLQRFRTEVLEVLAADHVRRANQALKTRLRRLIAVTAAALEGDGSTVESGGIELEKRRAAAEEVIGRETDRLAGSARMVLEATAEAVADAWTRGKDGASAARTAVQSAAGRALSTVRAAVEAARANSEAAPETRRVPPLFDPEFLDAIKELPSPRLAPGFLRSAAARRAVAPLLPFLDDALARFAVRIRAWGEGALKELQATPDDAPTGNVRNEELAPLERLVDGLDVPAGALASR
jgi:GTP-binding protein EngB required for normal cell division